MGAPFFSIIIHSSNTDRYESVHDNLSDHVFWHREAKKNRKLKPKVRNRKKSNDKFVKVDFEVIIESDIDVAIGKSNADYVIISEDNLVYSEMYLGWMHMFFTRVTLNFDDVILISPSDPIDTEHPLVSKSFLCSKDDYFKAKELCDDISVAGLQNKFYDMGYTPFIVPAAGVMNG